MLPPHNRPLAELAAEEGISEATLYNWRHDARDHGRLLPDTALTILFDGATNMVIE
jgi:transposase-like protein